MNDIIKDFSITNSRTEIATRHLYRNYTESIKQIVFHKIFTTVIRPIFLVYIEKIGEVVRAILGEHFNSRRRRNAATSLVSPNRRINPKTVALIQ